MVSPPQQLLAMVTDEPLEVDVPQFSSDQIQKIADLIENTALAQQGEDDVDLVTNGVLTPLRPSVKNLLTRTLIAMVSGLEGTEEVKSLRISLRRKT